MIPRRVPQRRNGQWWWLQQRKLQKDTEGGGEWIARTTEGVIARGSDLNKVIDQVIEDGLMERVTYEFVDAGD